MSTMQLLTILLTVLGLFTTILFTVVGATWFLAIRLNKFVTHTVCENRRHQCPCIMEIQYLKEKVTPKKEQ